MKKEDDKYRDAAEVLHELCINTKPGVQFSDLENLFGEGTKIQSMNGISTFSFAGANDDGSLSKYSLLYSDSILIKHDDATGEILELKCDEGPIQWSTQAEK